VSTTQVFGQAPASPEAADDSMPAALAGLTPEHVLEPTPVSFQAFDRDEKAVRTFEVYPMNDSALMVLSESLLAVVGLFDGAAADLPPFEDEGFGAAVAARLAPQLPRVLAVLLPNATRLIAASLGVPAEWVARNLSLADKLRALQAILEAENIPVLLGNFGALVGTFQRTLPAPAGTPAAA
jgi:hypothetical protein